jgi:hypothetical protein
MTTTTTPIGSTLDSQGTAREPEAGAAFGAATVQSARRTFLQYLRTPQLLVLPTIIGAMFLFIFRYVFGGAIDAGNGVDYVDFLVPGFLLTTILWTGMNAPAGVAEDAASGVHDRFRSLPIPRTVDRSPTARSCRGRCSSTRCSASRSASARTAASARRSARSS